MNFRFGQYEVDLVQQELRCAGQAVPVTDGRPDDTWAPLAERFVEGHYGSLRGRIRTHVVDAQLLPSAPGPRP